MKNISFLITILITTFITAQESSQNKSDFNFGNGVSLSFEDGDYNFSINGFIKPTYVYNEMTSIVDGGTINEFNRQFKSKNSVLEISGNAKKEKVSFSIRMDYSLSNPLLEAWVGYHPNKNVNVYFGQKNTFLNNREMIFNEDILQFTDRSLLSQNHTNSYGHEFGLFIETIFGEKFIISPKFAVTSGDGRNSFGEDSRDSDLGGVKFGARLDLYPFGNFSKGNEGSVDLVGEQKLIMELGFAYSKNIGTSHKTGDGHGDIMFYDANAKNNLPGLLSISFPGYKSDILMAKLDRLNFAVSNGSACNAGIIKPSKVLKAIGLEDEINLSTLRISFGKDNTIEEVDQFIKTLNDILN